MSHTDLFKFTIRGTFEWVDLELPLISTPPLHVKPSAFTKRGNRISRTKPTTSRRLIHKPFSNECMVSIRRSMKEVN